MHFQTTALWCAFFWTICVNDIEAVKRPTAITINKNGYKGLLVAIHPSVEEDEKLLNATKTMLEEASSYLYRATEKRAYFSQVTILLPKTWSSNSAWPSSRSELYKNADVIVQNPVSFRGKRSITPTSFPSCGSYTQTYGGCGMSGARINIFTDVFEARGRETYGPPGKLFVHEWAHFRWGVFDEFSQDGESQFYFSPTTGSLEAVRCNIHLSGKTYRRFFYTEDIASYAYLWTNQNGSEVPCSNLNSQNGLQENCVFEPFNQANYNENITASIMDSTNIKSVIHFCNDNNSDPSRVHNFESPSRHNRLCGSKSIWSIINEHADFYDGKNPPKDIEDTRPRFKIVRVAATRRMLIVIDTSRSMEIDDRLNRARQAATSFIEDGVDDGTELGVVAFSDTARIVVPITKITDESTRERISKMLPTRAEGATSIGSALLKCIEVLFGHDHKSSDDPKSSDAFIVIITDGAETSGLRLDQVMQQVKDAGVVVSTISFSDDKDSDLESLAEQTGGRYYYDASSELSISTLEAFMDVYDLLDSGQGQSPVQIMSRSITLNKHESVHGSFLMDSTLGKNTRAIITYTATLPNIVLVSPTGRIFSSIYPEFHHDPEMKRVKITIPVFAEIGRWSYEITNEDNTSKKCSVMVMSSPRDSDTPNLKFTGAILIENMTWPIISIIVAEVTRGNQPLKNLKVKAIVTRPLADPVEVELFDKGTGADVIKDDGIYSRFFTSFSASGRYSALIEMMDDSGDQIVTGGLTVDQPHVAKVYAGSVRIEHTKLPSKTSNSSIIIIDEYPPMKITDLRVICTSHRNGTVVLAWTAPGDDADNDRAFAYTILMSSTAEDMVKNVDLPALDKSAVIKGNLDKPQVYGSREEVTLKLNTSTDKNTSYVFSVFAVDESGNKGEMSNIVTVGLGFVPDILTQEFLSEISIEEKPDAKAAPDNQKVAIACVVGTAAGLLLATILGTFIVHYWMLRKIKKKEKNLFGQSQNRIV